MIRKKTDSGWWEGELQAKGRKRQVGWFPASYVKVLNSSGRISGRSTPVSTTRLQQEVVIGNIYIFLVNRSFRQRRQKFCLTKEIFNTEPNLNFPIGQFPAFRIRINVCNYFLLHKNLVSTFHALQSYVLSLIKPKY